MTDQWTSLKGKTALVTGGSRGIGRSIAKTLGKAGAKVIINYRSSEKSALECVAEIEKEGGQGIALGFDVGNSSEVSEAIDALQKEHGPISILVNNAGIAEDQLLMRVKEEQLNRVWNTNLQSMFFTSQACIRSMLKAKEGSIINMSSVIGQMGNAGQTVYGSSKAAILGFTKSLAREVAAKGIRVNAIAPGFIETEMTDSLNQNQHEKILGQIPVGKMGRPEDIANTALFLASPMSEYITGQVFGVNGGLYM